MNRMCFTCQRWRDTGNICSFRRENVLISALALLWLVPSYFEDPKRLGLPTKDSFTGAWGLFVADEVLSKPVGAILKLYRSELVQRTVAKNMAEQEDPQPTVLVRPPALSEVKCLHLLLLYKGYDDVEAPKIQFVSWVLALPRRKRRPFISPAVDDDKPETCGKCTW